MSDSAAAVSIIFVCIAILRSTAIDTGGTVFLDFFDAYTEAAFVKCAAIGVCCRNIVLVL